MAQSVTPSGTALPEPSSGITCLQVTEPKSPAIYELVTHWMTAERPSFWIDSRNVANTYRLYEGVRADRVLSGLQIARAFTAYQHYTLCQQLLQSVTPHTELVCLPNLTSLYRDDDVSEYERATLIDTVCDGVAELAATYDLPIVVSTIHDDEEYLYVVELPTRNPFDEPAEWTVKVSGHSSFPRWDGPTDNAFEQASWQFAGPLEQALEELVAEPA